MILFHWAYTALTAMFAIFIGFHVVMFAIAIFIDVVDFIAMCVKGLIKLVQRSI